MSNAERVRTVVMFQSGDFNCTEPREYFINDCCFGDDVAKWMREKLNAAGYAAAEPGQEDFGWYLPFEVSGKEYFWIVGFRPGDPPDPGSWIAIIERRGFLRMLLRKNRIVSAEVAQAIHEVLANDSAIKHERWHLRADFEKGIEELGSPVPA